MQKDLQWEPAQCCQPQYPEQRDGIDMNHAGCLSGAFIDFLISNQAADTGERPVKGSLSERPSATDRYLSFLWNSKEQIERGRTRERSKETVRLNTTMRLKGKVKEHEKKVRGSLLREHQEKIRTLENTMHIELRSSTDLFLMRVLFFQSRLSSGKTGTPSITAAPSKLMRPNLQPPVPVAAQCVWLVDQEGGEEEGRLFLAYSTYFFFSREDLNLVLSILLTSGSP